LRHALARSVTLPPTELAVPERRPGPRAPGGVDRYELLQVIGRGGMGEVRLVLDRRLGRIVAMKTLRRDLPFTRAAQARLLREALVQARLQHPAIVPVYDVGRAAAGDPYFTMKRVRGRSLSALLDRERSQGGHERTRARLLSAFGTVCLAMAYAHRKGVVHRDLKPDNVMLGDFGEVWVLDWGVAKADFAEARELSGREARSFVGTPGYMAPEQIEDFDAVDARADVYALGALLFEIVTREPLHPGRTAEEVIAATLRADRSRTAMPDQRLGEVCRRATAPTPSDRYPDARTLFAAFDRWHRAPHLR
jgi:serine/threonine-protein kinase